MDIESLHSIMIPNVVHMALLHSAVIPNVHMPKVAYGKDFRAYRILSQTIILFKDIKWIIKEMFFMRGFVYWWEWIYV